MPVKTNNRYKEEADTQKRKSTKTHITLLNTHSIKMVIAALPSCTHYTLYSTARTAKFGKLVSTT